MRRCDNTVQLFTMRTTLPFAALASLLALTALGQVSTDPQPRNILLEVFTAINCGNCPAGHAAAASVAAAHPGRVLLMNIHAGPLANPSGAQPDLRTPWGNQLAAASGLSFTPQGMVSRKPIGGSTLLSASSWGTAADALLAQTAIVNLSIATAFDPDTRLLTVEAQHYYTSPSTGAADRLHVVVAEDHITAYQANYGPGGAQQAYDHRYAVRAALTPFEGEALGSGMAGEGGASSFSFTLPLLWNAANVRIAGFVSEPGGEVHQVAEATAIGGSAGLEEASRSERIELAPNPSSGLVAIRLKGSETGVLVVRDTAGRIVHHARVEGGQRMMQLDAADLPEGLYFVTAEGGGSARLVIQR
jgi:hypothetical protein